MRQHLLISGLVLAAAACSRDEPTQAPATTDLHEASMSLDLEDLEPFLREMTGRLDGFGAQDVETIVKGVRSMAIDDESEWRFSVRREGRAVPFVVRVVLDDVEAPDLFLFSEAALASELQADLRAFSERRGK